MTAESRYVTDPASFRRCPVWLPQDPNVPHAERQRCILPEHPEGTDHIVDEKATGLLGKYEVRRRFDPTRKHVDCRYFVLDPQHDPLAREALRRYAQVATGAGYHLLAGDLRAWVDGIQ